jgi:hypothetical protein
MASFVTDFETHAIWQGYVEDPIAKDFKTLKARTIALSKARGSCHRTSNNQPIHEFGYPFGDSIPGLYCIAWLGRGHAESVSPRIFVRKKGMNRVQSNGRLHHKPSAKDGKGKIHW